MTFANYQLVIVHPTTGAQLDLLDGRRIKDFRYTRRVNDIGEFTLTVSGSDKLNQYSGVRDLLIDVYRTDATGKLQYENTYSLRYTEVFEDEEEKEWLIVSGEDLNSLFLSTRVIRADDDPAGANGYSTKDGVADQVMRDYVIDQAITPFTDSRRAFPGLTIAPILNLGQTIGLRKTDDETLLEVLQEATSLGRIDFRLTHDGALGFTFQILPLGRDKRRATNFPVAPYLYFTPERGNMKNPRLTVDAKTQFTAIYVKGQGPRGAEAERLFESPGQFDSPFNWREKVAQAQSAEQGSTTLNEQLETAGSAELEKNTQKTTFTFEINPTGPQARYQVDWFLGDKCTAGYMGFEQDFRIVEVEIAIGESGELITPTLEGINA